MKARCRRCWHLNYDYIFKRYDWSSPYFCGHHGCARVDPDGEQPNLDRRGGCAFTPKNEPTQLEFNFKK